MTEVTGLLQQLLLLLLLPLIVLLTLLPLLLLLQLLATATAPTLLVVLPLRTLLLTNANRCCYLLDYAYGEISSCLALSIDVDHT